MRYEIVRSLLRGNGLLTADVHGLRDRFGLTSRRGADPLSRLALFRREGRVYFAERSGDRWVPYRDYPAVVSEWDLWFEAPGEGRVVPLSRHYPRYDFCTEGGRRNLLSWIEDAAELVGR